MQVGTEGGGHFESDGIIAAAHYSVTLESTADQLTLTSGHMDDGAYPNRSLSCVQDADFRLEITRPF